MLTMKIMIINIPFVKNTGVNFIFTLYDTIMLCLDIIYILLKNRKIFLQSCFVLLRFYFSSVFEIYSVGNKI